MLDPDRLYVSTVCLGHDRPYPDVLRTYRRLSLPGIELGYCGDVDRLPTAAFEHDCSLLCHNYFLPAAEPFILNLASQDATILDRSRAYVRRAIDRCSDNDVGLYSFHSGFRTDPTLALEFQGSPAPYDRAVETFRRSLEELAPYAAERGVRLAIENNVLEPVNAVDGSNEHLLMCEAWEFRELFADLSAENVGVLLDTGHLRVTASTLSSDPQEFLETVRDDVVAIHAHDNDGSADEHRPPANTGWSMKLVSETFTDADVPVVLEGQYESADALASAVASLTGETER